MRETLVELKAASKYYKTDTHVVEALHGINLKFEQGEFVAVTGESGSGKSTLLRAICGLIPLDDGDLMLKGRSCFSCSSEEWSVIRCREIGIVWQDYKLVEHYTVMDNVIMALRIAGIEGNVQERAAEALRRVGLGNYENQRAGRLSSGQKQRLAIARAIAKDPKIFIFDDSFSALDMKTDAALRKALGENVKDSTVIIVAQRISTILHAEQILVLDDGKIVGRGTHKELLAGCEVYQQIAKSQLSARELGLEDTAKESEVSGNEQ